MIFQNSPYKNFSLHGKSLYIQLSFTHVSDMSDDAVKKLRDDLTNKAMLYLEQVCVGINPDNI